MARRTLLAALAALALGVFSPGAPQAGAAQLNVYYRANATSPWLFYSAAPDRAAGQTIVTEIQELGYLAEVVEAGTPQAAAVTSYSTYTAPTYYHGSSSYFVGGGGGGTSYHWWDHYAWHHHHGEPPHPTPHPHPHPTPLPIHHHHHHVIHHHHDNHGHHHHMVHHQHHHAHQHVHHHAAHHRK
jgi:hypothetical protein